jgi:uncharacterized protein YciI
MIKYIALFEKNTRKSVPNELMLKHIDHLKRLKREKHLFLCGPCVGTNKVIQIIIAGSKEEAEKYVRRDPFAAEGIFVSYSLFELNEANDNNNWLLPAVG